MWPFNGGWPLNGGPLNRGSTVMNNSAVHVCKLSLVQYIFKSDHMLCFCWHLCESLLT